MGMNGMLTFTQEDGEVMKVWREYEARGKKEEGQ